MLLPVSSADLDSLKSDLFKVNPQVPHAKRVEAAARALGFNTFTGMRTALRAGPQMVEPNDAVYADFLALQLDKETERVVSRIVARTAVRKSLETFPQLTQRGFDSTTPITPDERRMSWQERIAAFRLRREEALSDYAMDEFELAWIYLTGQGRRKTINRKYGSYKLKHRAENLERSFGVITHLGDYVSNGMLIAAAHAHGLQIKRASPTSFNAYFNLSSVTIQASYERPVLV